MIKSVVHDIIWNRCPSFRQLPENLREEISDRLGSYRLSSHDAKWETVLQSIESISQAILVSRVLRDFSLPIQPEKVQDPVPQPFFEEETMPRRTIVTYSIGVESPITPDEPLPPLPKISKGSVVVIEGRAPIWRYGMAFHLLHGSPAIAIAMFDPRLGNVVVASHSTDYTVGQIIE